MEAVSQKKMLYFSALICLIICLIIGNIIAEIENFRGVASIFSIISACLVLLGSYQTRKIRVEEKVNKAVEYVKRNFDKWNIILALVDVACSLIALFSGLLLITWLAGVSFAGRIIALVCKFRSVSFAVVGSLILYMFKRRKMLMSEEINVEPVKVKKERVSLSQILTIIFGILGVGFAVVSYFVPDIAILGDQLINVLGGLGITAISGGIGIFTKYRTLTEEQIKALTVKEEEKAENKAEKLKRKRDALLDKEIERRRKKEANNENFEKLLKEREEKKLVEEVKQEENIVVDKDLITEKKEETTY